MKLNKNEVLLLLGTNLGDKLANIEVSTMEIETAIGQLLKKSSVYKSPAWGFNSSSYFLNQVVLINTKLNPFQLLNALQKIEIKLGRKVKSQESYQDRLIDIDILFFENQIVNKPELIIPHPEIENRRFTLLPLQELVGNYIHPIKNKSIIDITKECDDDSDVSIY